MPGASKATKRWHCTKEFVDKVVERDPDPWRRLGTMVKVDFGGDNAQKARAWLEDLTVAQRQVIRSDGVFHVNMGLVLWTPLHVSRC